MGSIPGRIQIFFSLFQIRVIMINLTFPRPLQFAATKAVSDSAKNRNEYYTYYIFKIGDYNRKTP